MRINDFWKEGKYLDLWSVNHLLSGVLLGVILFYFHLHFFPALVISLVLFVGWEVIELLIGINEHFTNIVMDVVCDTAGFLLTAYFHFALGKSISIMGFVIIGVIFLLFNLWGFLAYEKRLQN